MKHVPTLKSSRTDSPQTPGGISRSLLTPCRRVGLSRNFRKSGASPFHSPLSSITEVKKENVDTRKRKEPSQGTSMTPENVDVCDITAEDKNVQTPTRKVELPRRKKSKTLLTTINNSSNDNEIPQENVGETYKNNTNSNPCKTIDTESIHSSSNHDMPSVCKDNNNIHSINKEAVTPLSLKCKSRCKKNFTSSNSISKQLTTATEKEKLANNTTEYKENEQVESKETSPNNLTKECVVVIQKKLFKKELHEMSKLKKDTPKNLASSSKTQGIISQPVFDSDSDDEPLICLNKDAENKNKTIEENDHDFDPSKTKLSKPVKTKSKTKVTSPATKMKSDTKVVEAEIHNSPFQKSDEDDDDFFEKKRTILIKKCYQKVTKPQKAKSTGSITQRDIDDLKARIETKKKMLLARAMSEDTKELRDLIKKWQKGCQDALMELMDLMKSKFPDKQNMDYSEMLQTLKIPYSLVGYDSDNDCFLTPDDESIILAKV